MNIEDRVLELTVEIMDALDKIDKPEDKRRIITWVSNVWNHNIRQLAAYTNVPKDMIPTARSAINNQLAGLKETVGKS